MRYLIKFTKGSNIKFISHLDLMRTIQKIIRRSELPIEYSKGFNPHMALSLAQPLSVGVYSDAEYMDIVLTEFVDNKTVLEKLNENSSNNIRFLESSNTEIIPNQKRVPQGMALLDAANYTIKIRYYNTEKVLEEVKALLEKETWETLKKTKKGEKMADIKPLVKDFKYWVNEDFLVINATISCGSRENLSADLLASFVKLNTTGFNEEAFVEIKREEMYALKDEKLVPLYKYI
ncbi:radical SAM-linked protein [Clostridium cavendishii DSM 21758]|uniref:Radical SAM-linked protein n=1 Tax=Clostridium cavendishii DSM 21758 TaxID=1121302 RepID=A0A1M6BJ32_9CLOT|nr:TIGR03936 family radical SAM-associated protein [Clostridium cavendishii]SHI48731.1 radical SAM-linked protein [Clostridium cavendishii DSM 21758]